MVRLLIADDEPLIRRGIKKLVNLSEIGIEEVYEADNGEETLQLYEQYHPEIVLLDINMPRVDGLTVAKEIKSLSPKTKIAMLTGYNYFDYAQKAIRVGVEDYILKPVSKKEITEIIAKLAHSYQEERKQETIQKVFQQKVEVIQENSKNDYHSNMKRYMEENYTDSQFSLGVLAEKLNLSSGYLSILFKKTFGIPFQDYLLQLRMEKAKLLLLTTHLKNYEIAEQIGFEDVNYFSLKFKKYFQLSPKQYKEMVLKNEN
ncbi:response regulator transcription factor [Fusobacterium gonidiaformans]|uniref:response regulator transcription factor n=1 Tax=Fusobacterium gonidiaformans TaxID=849 RepID=UPI0005868961|nr:response regulator [Fusobacterium gonidiaformans]